MSGKRSDLSESVRQSDSDPRNVDGSGLDLCKVCVILLLGLEATTSAGLL